MELEQIAVRDDYFVKRNLYPNVDFYSGIVLRALDIPVSMYTVIFAVARTVGWVSQWKEMVSEDTSKITRPRQMYMGHLERQFVAVARRGDASVIPNSCDLDSLLEDTAVYADGPYKRAVSVRAARVGV